ncbi:acyl-CoA dehydrogenase C-terminal domain-containing protein [Deinococcus multiflagellatus]|uniref:Acyl-CoA dehydrogenase C-terminal domain-containing protein n=1 Tax=Deinococcus multiflagellatus TaxID=1656887 RepID=A0ABW1ZSX0_9DEIO
MQGLLRRAAELGPERTLAGGHSALQLLGGAVVGWMWLRQGAAAARALAGATGEEADFYRGKLQAARFFALHELPALRVHIDLLNAADPTALDMSPNWF